MKTYTVQVSFEVEARNDKAASAEAVRILQEETPTDHMEVEEGQFGI
jgi:hypothetical protein